MLSSLINFSISNRWMVALLATALLVVGVLTALKMPVDVFPDFSPVQVVVLTEAPGFAPEEVESLITRPLELGLNGTANVSVIRSTSTVGLSVITVLFNDNTDIYRARQQVTEKLQANTSKLPAEAHKPVLAPITPAAGDIVKLGFYAKGKTSLMQIRTLIDWTVKMRLVAVQGVANVVVIGGDEKQYQILVDPQKLKQFDVTMAQVVEAARNSNVNAAGGYLRTPEQEFLIRGLGRALSTEEIAQTVVTSKGAVPVLLGNVAKVEIGPAFKIGDAVVDGHPGVVLTVFKQPWANTLETTKQIEKALEQMKPSFPADLAVVSTFRQADFIEVAIANVGEAIGLGGILVVVILLVFLQNWRTAFISLTAIPLSLLIAVIALKLQGDTINTMTLGGLAIAIGEVVDDAIIDVENVYRRLRENSLSENPKSALKVIADASKEVRGSVVYATFIIGLVFLPVLSLGGLEGKIFSPLAFSYMVSLFASLAVALTVTPAMCCIFLGSAKKLPPEETWLVRFLKRIYESFLHFSLGHPVVVVVISALIFLFSLSPLAVVGHEFLPSFDENNVIVVSTAMPGTSLDTTTNVGKELTAHFVKEHNVLAADQRAGRAEGGEDYGTSNFSEYDIRMHPESTNKKDILYHVRHEFAHIPGLVTDSGSYLQHRMDHALSGVNAAIAIKVFGTDLHTLYKKAKQIEEVMKKVDGTVEVHVEPIVPVPQISIRIDRLKAARYGVKVGHLSDSIEAAFKGVIVSQVLEGQQTFDLNVWFDPAFRNNLDVIEETLIDTPAGIKVPLSAVASVSAGESPNAISHESMSRRVVVQANVKGRDLGSVIDDARRKIAAEVELPTGYYIVYGGQFEAQEEAQSKLSWLASAALVGMFLLLWLAFRSAWAAILILVNLPLALIGGIWAVLLSGAVLSVGSLVGFITLLGISTRNGIMIVSHFNHLLAEGHTLEEILWQGSLDRLVPVLMTALTAALGVLPIAILGGAGRELEQPMAIVILGGMFSSTLLTLLVVPALFKIIGKRALIVPSEDEQLD